MLIASSSSTDVGEMLCAEPTRYEDYFSTQMLSTQNSSSSCLLWRRLVVVCLRRESMPLLTDL